MNIEAVRERFFAKTQRMENGCLEWQAGYVNGYGQFWMNGKSMGAHRVAWELEWGAKPGFLYVCHTCDNMRCVESKHLFAGSQKDNVQDCAEKGRRVNKRKVSNETIKEIQQLRGLKTQMQLSAEFGISQSHVSRILARKDIP